MRKLFVAWLPVLIWSGLIFWGSTDALSAGHTSRIIVPLLRWLKPDLSDEAASRVQLVIRKSGHAFEYAVLALLLARALHRSGPNAARATPWAGRTLVVAWALAAAYAMSDEFHQSFYASREASWRDVGIDSAGAAVALTLAGWWSRRRCRARG